MGEFGDLPMSDRDGILAFLKRIDEKIDRAYRLVVVGGSAGILAETLSEKTRDIDAISPTNFRELETIWKEVAAELGSPLALDRVDGVTTPPYNFESRLIPIGCFTRLIVHAMESHDLTLMKIQRFNDHDRTHIKSMHESKPLYPELLLSIFTDEILIDYVGNNDTLKSHFLVMINDLFGDDVESQYREKLQTKAS